MTYELQFDCTGSRWVTTSGTTDSSSTTATMGTETDYHEKETWLVMSNLGTGMLFEKLKNVVICVHYNRIRIVIIVKIFFICSFPFIVVVLYNHSFKT